MVALRRKTQTKMVQEEIVLSDFESMGFTPHRSPLKAVLRAGCVLKKEKLA